MNKHIFLFAAFVLCLTGLSSLPANAQYTEDFRAKDVLEKQYVDIKGSPYISDEWTEGVVKMQSGPTYKMPLKYDQVKGELIFKDRSGREMTFADPVAGFMLSGKDGDRVFRNGFKGIEGREENYFFEVLYDGGTPLLKDPKKNIVEHRAYNSSTAVKSILEAPAYYIVLKGEAIRIKKDKNSVLSALEGSSDALDKYIQDQKLNLKDDAGLAKLLQYYDTLKL